MLYEFLKKLISMGYPMSRTKQWVVEFLNEEFGFSIGDATEAWRHLRNDDREWIDMFLSHEGDFIDSESSFVESMNG